MMEVAEPTRRGETLGAYYWWSKDLQQALERCNLYQQQERAHYLGE